MESSPQLCPGPRTDYISLRDRNVDIGAHCRVFLDSPPPYTLHIWDQEIFSSLLFDKYPPSHGSLH